MEDDLLHRVKHAPRAPWMRTRRDSEVHDALLEHAARWWLERHPDEDHLVVCAKSKRSAACFGVGPRTRS